MKFGQALYIKDSNERKDINNFQMKIEALKEYIDSEFPNGCKEFYEPSCRACPLQLCKEGTKWFYLCELLDDLSRNSISMKNGSEDLKDEPERLNTRFLYEKYYKGY